MNTEIKNNEPEKQTDDKKTVNKSEKVTEKLKVLREKLGKSVEAQTVAEKKTKDIRTEIAKCEKFLHDEEVRALDAVCNENHITFAEATEFIKEVTSIMPISDAAEILGIKMRKADNNE
ncbi:MAG: hypothetical protein ACI4JK_06545 [Oscillospiraceae bacterium]